jgi:hypothetical protein
MDQVVAPRRPVVDAGRPDCHGSHALRLEPGNEPLGGREAAVARGARHPKEFGGRPGLMVGNAVSRS